MAYCITKLRNAVYPESHLVLSFMVHAFRTVNVSSIWRSALLVGQKTASIQILSLKMYTFWHFGHRPNYRQRNQSFLRRWHYHKILQKITTSHYWACIFPFKFGQKQLFPQPRSQGLSPHVPQSERRETLAVGSGDRETLGTRLLFPLI